MYFCKMALIGAGGPEEDPFISNEPTVVSAINSSADSKQKRVETVVINTYILKTFNFYILLTIVSSYNAR